MSLTITRSEAGFTLAFPYRAELVAAVKSLPSRRFDPTTKSWTVPASGASALRDLLKRLNGTEISLTDDVREALEAGQQATVAAITASRATDWHGDIPVPEGLAYLPYQRAGIAYAMSRPASLIGDEMGLGKTIQAIGTINADANVRSVLVICPASLKINWAREMRKWLSRPLSVSVANGVFPQSDVVITNYDILKKHARSIRARSWDMLICDECHALKNPKAQRTQQVLGKRDRDPAKAVESIKAGRKLFLTGTPILNRPIELWPLVHALDPTGLGASWKAFVTRYCDGHQASYGWDVSGASHLDELQDRLRVALMVRRLKSEVLTELPAKRRAVVVLPTDDDSAVTAETAGYEAAQASVEEARHAVELAKAEDDDTYASAIARLTAASSAAFAEISKLRHATALSKVPQVVAYLRDLVESEKIVIFAHHLDVLATIAAEYPGCVVLTGENTQEQRQAAVDRFQTDPDCRLFVGSIKAAGVGLTLTAASHVVFAELDWVPGYITQAEDRCHRIGQANSVLIEHLVLDGSLDVRMANTLIAKQEVIDRALDDKERSELASITISPDAAATANTPRSRVAKLAEDMTPEQIERVHTALQMLAAMCDGARNIDGAGFNKLDARLGKDLAMRLSLTAKQAALGQIIAHKYRRQLGDSAV